MSLFKERLRSYIQSAARDAMAKLISDESKDIELQQQLNARATSASFADAHFCQAKLFRDKFDLLKFALSLTPAEGLYCEFGVYQATTANVIAEHIGENKLHGFDSFEGLPEHWRGDLGAGLFSLDSKLPKVRSNVELHVGWFDKTLPEFLNEHAGSAAFLHVDSDLYSSARCVFANFGSRIVSGTVIVFDEYFNYPSWEQHEHRAFMEFIEPSGIRYQYIAYNAKGHQVAVKIL